MGCTVSISFLAFAIVSWSQLGDVYSYIEHTDPKQCRTATEKIQTDALAGRRTYKKVGPNLFLHMANECLSCRDFKANRARHAQKLAKFERTLVEVLHAKPGNRLHIPKSENEDQEKLVLATLRNGSFRFFADESYHLYPEPNTPEVTDWRQHYLDKYRSLESLTLMHSDLVKEIEDIGGLRRLLHNSQRHGEFDKTSRRYYSALRRIVDVKRAITILHPLGKAAFTPRKPKEPI